MALARSVKVGRFPIGCVCDRWRLVGVELAIQRATFAGRNKIRAARCAGYWKSGRATNGADFTPFGQNAVVGKTQSNPVKPGQTGSTQARPKQDHPKRDAYVSAVA
jgi:hypothetical protein